MRENVDHEKLHAKPILKSELKEILLDVFMVKHYSNDLFTDIENDDNKQGSYLEDTIYIFLTVRGYAVTRLVKKRNIKKLKGHKSSDSLRDALKNISSNIK